MLFVLEYELVAVGKKCGSSGSNNQIKLSENVIDPSVCKSIAEKTVENPSCGDYFGIKNGICGCSRSDMDCTMTDDVDVTLYRIIEKGNLIALHVYC